MDIHERRRDLCDGSNEPGMEYMCGRPLGLQFNKQTCDLYIADAYYGLLKVTRNGGVATRLASSADNLPFKFTNAVDIDPCTDSVYFTDSSIFFPRWAFALAVISGDKSGRLMKYDPRSQRVTVLLSGLRVANGVALSRNNNFILVAETAKNRVMRYWLEGPNARKYEVFAELPTFPDNIKRNDKGEFWVALNNGRGTLDRVHRHGIFNDDRYRGSLQSSSNTTCLKSELRSSTPVSKDAVAIKFNEEAEILEVLSGEGGRALESVSEVEEYQGTLWIGSVVMPYVIFAKT
ncbi:hypothetical protein Syun_023151 [Stephania yunnanensis]|uniref:Strictosidine synthase conserved region domain-containing protein n=1 Tax=Stephania yunnanensis TaxID=152371 RepID=A0AAP0F8D2_9MAGN